MVVRTRFVRALGVGAMVVGMLGLQAGPAHATPTDVGTCFGMKSIAKSKSSIIGAGWSDFDNSDLSISLKGVDPTVIGGTNLGLCLFAAGLSTPDSDKPINKGSFTGFKSIKKWSGKLYSPEADCNPDDDTTDATEWPLNGTLNIDFNALTPTSLKNQKMAIQFTVDGYEDFDNDPDTPSDVLKYHGLVTKGVAAGADVSGQSYFQQVVKDKTQIGNAPYIGYQNDYAAWTGCWDGTPNNSNSLVGVWGDGVSFILEQPASGLTFTFGD